LSAPVWQRNYYERIVRDENDLQRIREYILDNPRKWLEDPDNPANLSTSRV
jgi:REP element-mobilizing transposase RayT